ncbi:unnamed protein product [Zymoseptoria tritici ST99CH_1A5]|uniref:Uncharacterized protein n=2 Tax=Zymoseptoria tritici TaxID=1047171 RepID=A0A1X7S8X2_ZYMT9|nr:unnamed protein product [Zymoseptoria tritici ST99CH_3D7]SMY29531.1 unnamed protein product [Zymoseptoria tritici ST99CH_1A5]
MSLTLVVAVDFGTTKVDATVRIRESGVPLELNEVVALKLGHKNAAPQIVGFDNNNNFVWGDGVTDALTSNEMSPEDVIEVFKLSLYKAHATSEIAERVNNQLRRLNTTKEEVISLLIKAVVQKAGVQVEDLRGMWRSLDGTGIDEVPVELFLSVPDMWKAPANRYMTIAAKMAGVASVQLVTESLCAAAYFMQDMQKSKRTALRPGDGILVLDAGGGTTDITCYEMPKSAIAGAETKLQRTGISAGGLCGSHFINERFIKWVRAEADNNLGGFAMRVASLGYAGAPYAGFYRAANEAFDRIKPDFTPAAANSGTSIWVTIKGNPHSPSRTSPVWQVELPCTLMKSFFDTVIDDNFRLVAPLITTNIKRIIVPGGLGNSQYFRNELQARLQPAHPTLKISEGDALLLTGQQPVSAGALLRYNKLDLDAAPRVGCFGVVTDETFDATRHPDGIIKAGTLLPNKTGGRHRKTAKDKLNRDIVVRSRINDGGEEALMRWDPILRSDTGPFSRNSNKENVSGTWQTRYIDARDVKEKKALEFQLYWTDDTSIVPGSAIFEGNPMDGKLKPEVETWGPTIRVACPDLKGLGFDTEPVAKVPVYQIAYMVEVKERGPNCAVKVRMVLPTGRQPFDDLGKPIFEPGALPKDVEMLDILEEPMEENGFHPFTRN